MAALITILILVLTLTLSWLVTCGIVFLAALCFGFSNRYLAGSVSGTRNLQRNC